MVNTNICVTTADAIERIKAAGWELAVKDWGFSCTYRKWGTFRRIAVEYQDDLGSLVLRLAVQELEDYSVSRSAQQ